MNESTDNFWAAFESWQAEPQVVHVPLYRLYYDDRGYPLCYSGDDIPGNYIDVELDVFHRALTNVRVIDGKLKIFEHQHVFNKLIPNTVQGTACDPTNVCIIVDATQPHTKWNLKDENN
jgi:hypothetical protein